MLCQRLIASKITDLKKAARLILAGDLVAFPTETVYGLGALGLDEKAIEKIFKAKGRPSYNPLIFHVASAEKALELLDLDSDKLFWELATQYWPGPLTLVGPKKQFVPQIATGGLDTVAVRVPAHPIALELLKQINAPVVAPSANASQRPSSTTAEHVLLTLENQISAVLDAGPCQYGLESTVVDITHDIPVILRQGALRLDCFDINTSGEIKGSPGRLDKHYAPLIPEIRLASQEELAIHPPQTALLLHTPLTHSNLNLNLNPLYEILPNTPEGYAKGLFAALYRLESQKPARLLIEEVPKTPEWAAIRDRLKRALS